MEMICCEVCGSCLASAVMVPCAACPPGRRKAGCHSFCFPGPKHSIASMPSTFTCLNCSDMGRTNGVPAAAATTSPQPAGCGEAAAAGASVELDMSPAGQVDHAAAAAAVGLANTDSAAGSEHPRAMDWAQLPIELLPAILRHVGLQDRLCRCALVSTAWAAAAKAATTSISISRPSATDLQETWAARVPSSASQVSHLELTCQFTTWASSGQDLCILHLPCMLLRSLQVQGCGRRAMTVQLLGAGAMNCSSESAPLQLDDSNPERSIPGLLDTATGLTRLSLQMIVLHGDAEQQLAAALTVLTDLQDLSLSLVRPYIPGEGQLPWLLSDSIMQQLGGLTKLTQLQLAAFTKQLCSSAGVQHLSCLKRLCSLSLTKACCKQHPAGEPMLYPEATVLLHLTALTSLKLSCGVLSPHWDKLPSLGSLSSLQQLLLQCSTIGFYVQGVCDCVWDPATVLAGVTGLRRLQARVPADASALLAAVQQQKLLAHVELYVPRLEAAAAYAVCTASPELQSLVLNDIQLVDGAWGCMFPQGRLLPHLTSLQAVSYQKEQLSTGDLQLLVQACPALQQLQVNLSWRDWPADVQLGQALAELSHLTQLCVPGVTDTHLQQLLQLTGLQDLQLGSADSISFEGVAVLTAMQQLTHLQFSVRRVAHKGFRNQYDYRCDSKKSLPVWLQLRKCWERKSAAAQRAEARQRSMLDQMGLPHEGYAEAHHGRCMRSVTSRAAEKQGMGMAGRGSGSSRGRGRGRGRRGG